MSDGVEPSASGSGNEQASTSGRAPPEKKPIALLVIGMAGSGKTTLMQRVNAYLHEKGQPAYLINLDPAVKTVPYGPNVDIRDTVNYKNVMKQYNLGPNGGILTSSNLFATRFDQVIRLLEKPRQPPLDYVLVDTPGQIEIFTWSASGSIVTELLASSMPTVVAYIIDTPRCIKPETFMANMLQACSILYKTRLPLLLVFNKVDVQRADFALQWMQDCDAFQEAIDSQGTFASTLCRSLCLVLDEFYANLRSAAVSAVTGEGVDELFEAAQSCAEEYRSEYLPELRRRREEMAQQEIQRQQVQLEKLKADIADTQGRGVVLPQTSSTAAQRSEDDTAAAGR